MKNCEDEGFLGNGDQSRLLNRDPNLIDTFKFGLPCKGSGYVTKQLGFDCGIQVYTASIYKSC